MKAVPLHPWPLEPHQLAALKEAKAQLNVDYQIQPVRSYPGVPTTVLAFETLPPFLCRVALIKPGWSVTNVRNALSAVLSGQETGLFDEADYLAALMPGTREIEAESVEQKVRFE